MESLRKKPLVAAALFVLLLACVAGLVNAWAAPSHKAEAKAASQTVPVENNSLFEFVYLDASQLSQGSTQHVVVSFADPSLAQQSTTLTYQVPGRDQPVTAAPAAVAEGAVRYDIPCSAEGAYVLDYVTYANAAGQQESVLLPGVAEDQLGFSVMEDCYNNGVSVNATSLTDAGKGLQLEGSTLSSLGGEDGAVSLLATGYEVDPGKTLVVALDPGHCGNDSGACYNGMQEADLNLAIALYCKAALEQYPNVKVVMTRTSRADTGMSMRDDLIDRVEIAAKAGADVFVSFHINASAYHTGSGFYVEIQHDGAYRYELHEESEVLGAAVLDKLVALGISGNLGLHERWSDDMEYPDGTTADYLSVLRNSRLQNIPAVLIEHGFIDNWDDAWFLADDDYLKAMGEADAAAIIETYGVKIDPLEYYAPVFDAEYYYNNNPDLQTSIGTDANKLLEHFLNHGMNEGRKGCADFDVFDFRKAYPYLFDGEDTALSTYYDHYLRFGSDYLDAHDPEAWFYDSVYKAAKAGMITGYGDGEFGVKDNLTRAQVAVILWRYYRPADAAVCDSSTAVDTTGMRDLEDKKYYTAAVNWAVASGVFSGKEVDNTRIFDPNGYITREELCAVVANASQRFAGTVLGGGEDLLSAMPDAGSVSEWAQSSVAWCLSKGIISGVETDQGRMVNPADQSSRAEMAAITMNTIDKGVFGGVDTTEYPEGYNAKPVVNNDATMIMGTSLVTVDQMVERYAAMGRTYPSSVYASKGAATTRDFFTILYEEANAEGVRAEVVFAQAMHETGWLQYGGDVNVEQCNFAGIGATGNGAKGNSFTDVREGLRAQVQHLKAYASTEPLNQACVDPRFTYVTRGCAPTVYDLGGKWATGGGYGEALWTQMVAVLAQ